MKETLYRDVGRVREPSTDAEAPGNCQQQEAKGENGAARASGEQEHGGRATSQELCISRNTASTVRGSRKKKYLHHPLQGLPLAKPSHRGQRPRNPGDQSGPSPGTRLGREVQKMSMG